MHTTQAAHFALVLALYPFSAVAQVQDFKAIPPQENRIIAHEISLDRNGQALRSTGDLRQAYVGPADTVFPHFATGAGWETILVLVNLSSTKVTFTQNFYDPTGKSLQVTFKSVPEGVLTTTSAAQGTLNPGGSFNILLFDQGGGLKTGWSSIAYDSSNSRIGGYAIFRQRVQGSPDFEALVPLSAYDDSVFVMPYDNLEGFVTSMAILNPGANLTSTVKVTIRDSTGATIATDSISLSPGQQQAFVIPDRLPATKNRVGTILFEGSTTRLSGLGFRFNPGHAFATIPILNWLGMF